MVHADAATFQPDVSKQEAYTQVMEQAAALFEGQRNWVAQSYMLDNSFESEAILNSTLLLLDSLLTPMPRSNLANTASLLWHAYKALPAPLSSVNWSGFYVLDPLNSRQLILGPFHGKIACQTIAFHKGVCGAAAATGTTQLVPDVDAFPGHIACDGDSRSEIVVPVKVDGRVVAIIDVDCVVLNGFDAEDRKGLEELADLLSKNCDW
ncbi:hypothetical protein MMC18_009174 [Xylographa bjoerkii]|nr:hypothetical protein [Xylographa bjoerkii]